MATVGATDGTSVRSADEEDLFRIDGPTSTIPPVEKILLPPEEVRRRRIRWILVVVSALALVGLTAKGVQHWIWLSDVTRAVHEASAGGRPAALYRAIEMIDSERSPGLDARIRAVALLSGLEVDGIESQLERVGAEDRREHLEGRLATLYHALATGALDKAIEVATSIRPVGESGPEVAYAKALVGFSVGDMAHARAMAAEAVRRSPGTTRHAALLIVILGRSGTLEEVEAVMASVPEEERGSPNLKIARARVAWIHGLRKKALTLAAEVEDDDSATPAERAWAHLIRATMAAEAGLRDDALAAAFDAEAASPPGDETFQLHLAEVFLRVGDVEWAMKVRLRAALKYSVDPERRSRVDASISLEKGLYSAAERALDPNDASPETQFLRGQLNERQGRLREATTAYELATSDPRVLIRARVRWAAIELMLGQSAAALGAIKPVLEDVEGHPELAPVAVDVFLAVDKLDEARRLADGALVQHPRDPRVLGAAARVHMATKEWKEAVGLLQSSLRIDPDNLGTQRDLGRAAHALGEIDIARRAYETALRMHPTDEQTLMGALGLFVAVEDIGAAAATVEQLERLGVRSRELELLRAETYVLSGAGHRGILDLQPAMATRDRAGVCRSSNGSSR